MLRGVCGSGQWLGSQCCPWILARVLMLQGMVPHATVQPIMDANKLVRGIRETCSTPLVIRKHREVCFVAWHDAAWASRPDQHSQGGFIVAAADVQILQGERMPCSIMSWASRRLPRVARSSAAAEVQGMSEGLEELEYLRFAWAELVAGHSLSLIHI